MPPKTNTLEYPFGKHVDKAPGEYTEVAPGVFWLRLPLPFVLDHINVWLLEDGDGWTLVDTGVNTSKVIEIWKDLFTSLLAGRPLKRVIVTHMHPDHVGLAGWLCEHFDCRLWISRLEFLTCHMLVKDTSPPPPHGGVEFYRAAGLGDAFLDEYVRRFGQFGKSIYPLPRVYKRMEDGQQIEINGDTWQVIVGSGHSPEHCCLYNEARNLLISGDQVIARISSNVSVFPTEPDADPLHDWLSSCYRFKVKLPADVLVLPAHQEPFTGLHTRLDQLIAGHEEQLSLLMDHLGESRRAVDCFPVLFEGEIDNFTALLAVGETIAHLNYLMAEKRVGRKRDVQGIDYYLRVRQDEARYTSRSSCVATGI